MNAPKHLIVPTLVLPALVAFASPAEGPAFHPEEGSSVTKTFENRFEFDLEDFSIVADGQDMGGMLGGIELSVSTEQTIRVADVYEKMADGQPAKLVRTYETLAGAMSFDAMSDFGGDSQELPSESDLEGQSVVFTWNADEDEYEVSFEEGEGDEELLEGLEEDMDLRVLLPTEDVEEGDSWEVDIKDLTPLLMPGGDLGFAAEDDEEMDSDEFDEMFGDFGEKLDEAFEGSCTCTFVGTREEDGVQLAEIEVSVEINSAIDLSELIMDAIDSAGEEDEMIPDLTIDVAELGLDFEGVGTLVWNLGAGRVEGFEITGDADFSMEVAASADVEGESHSGEIMAEFSGSVSLGVETEG